MRGSVSRGGVGFKGVRGARLFFTSYRTPHHSRLTPLEPRVMLDADMTADAHRAQLIHIETDRRLGHEWDEWDGRPLPGNGDFSAPPSLFFRYAGVTLALAAGGAAAALFLLAPRLAAVAPALPTGLWLGLGVAAATAWLWFGVLLLSFYGPVLPLPVGL